ncbi:Membrane protein putatively involved in post-translational modification of the autoinducing quorum-sensing peptide [uncultured Clostridium sp.]|uniref:accessory gene regulator B family protein n=1 Tax=uncultured Clostridium sp. TaxID=59620 RepID=UPI000821DE0D|nr:accessory gene regulator B family protein [uncultured Clostridium sp.]SCI75811.1 Membrane protein putatively involved in post-translational modification of the autoinducing quorum-sensing peptide [uncultured Clostridium sp.]
MKIIERFVNEIASYNSFTKEQKEEVEYTLKIIIYELIKIIVIIAIFYLFGYLKESLMVLFVMGVTKPFIGGYHEESQIKCFIATLILVAIIIQLSITSNISYISGILLNLVSVFAVYNKAPIINEKMPITRVELIKRNRVLGITNISILAIGSLIFFYSTILSQVVIWTICIQSMLMFNKNQYKIYKG